MSLVSFTRTLIVANVRRQLMERVQATFIDADIQRWVDMALLDISVRNRCLRTDASGTSLSGTQMYSLTADCVGPWAITRLEYNGKRLWPKAFDAIDEEFAEANGKSLSSTGTPAVYFCYGRQIGFWPVPVSGGTYRYWYPQMAPSLSADAMTLADCGFSLAYSFAAEHFAVAQGLLLQGEKQAAQGFMAMYEQDVARAGDQGMSDAPAGETRGSG